MRLRRLISLSLLVPVIGVPAALAPPAQAGPDQVSIMQDDDLLLYRSDAVRVRTLVKMSQLGADAVRVTVLWRVAAEGANLSNAEIGKLKSKKAKDAARKQRARFKPKNPGSYPVKNWDRYDNLVREAGKLGMRVFFSVTGPGPRYGHEKAPASQKVNAPTYKPIPAKFGEFVEAVARRYSGGYKDENATKRVLPRVGAWTLWNEPNQAGWLSPQWEKRGGETVPSSPIQYRRLYQAGRAALERRGHGGDIILLGETAPSGATGTGARSHVRPKTFLRELACVSPAGVPYTGAAAANRGCASLGAGLKASGYAHHPYTKKVAPTVAPTNPDDINIGNIATLGPLLDQLSTQSGGKIPNNMALFMTEFGYESNPPDPRNGIPYARQATFNQLAEFLLFNQPRVKATTQFQLRDAAPLTKYAKGSRLYWFTYQSGLYTQTGKTKPAAIAYAMPFVAFPAGEGQVGFWGQLRFRPGAVDDLAILQWRPTPQAPWAQVGDAVKANVRGFFQGQVAVPGPGGEYRAAYVNPATSKVAFASLAATL